MPVIRYNFKKLAEQAKVTVLILDPKVPMFPILGIVIFHKIPKQSVLLITSISQNIRIISGQFNEHEKNSSKADEFFSSKLMTKIGNLDKLIRKMVRKWTDSEIREEFVSIGR